MNKGKAYTLFWCCNKVKKGFLRSHTVIHEDIKTAQQRMKSSCFVFVVLFPPHLFATSSHTLTPSNVLTH